MNGKVIKRKNDAEANPVLIGQHHRKKRKLVGVLRERFYPASDGKAHLLLDDLRNLKPGDEAAKEIVFSEHRETIQHLFTQASSISTAVPGFFNHPSHCRFHFEHLAGMSIVKNIEEELDTQMELIREVLNVWCRTEASKKRMETADILSREQQGSKIPQYVCLLRELTFMWHKNLGGLVRYPQEEELSSPHILCYETQQLLRFDVHVEQRKVLGNLSFADAVASFFHIIFIAQMKYPPEGEAVAILLQRRLAKIDEEGQQHLFLMPLLKATCWAFE